MSNSEHPKEPMSRDKIYKIMLRISITVAFVFFIKGLIGKDFDGAIFIGASLAAYMLLLGIMKYFKVSAETKQLVVSIVIMLLIFCVFGGRKDGKVKFQRTPGSPRAVYADHNAAGGPHFGCSCPNIGHAGDLLGD